jgi:hypothetical protein
VKLRSRLFGLRHGHRSPPRVPSRTVVRGRRLHRAR